MDSDTFCNFTALTNSIQGVNLTREGDEWEWLEDKNRTFSTKSVRKLIDNSTPAFGLVDFA